MIGRTNAIVEGISGCNIQVGSEYNPLIAEVYYTDISGNDQYGGSADSTVTVQVPKYSTVRISTVVTGGLSITPPENAELTATITEALRQLHYLVLIKGDCVIQ